MNNRNILFLSKLICISMLMVILSSCQTTHSIRETKQPDMIAILKTELASLDLQNPKADLERNYSHGDKRFIGIYGFALYCPGTEGLTYDYIKQYGIRPINGTSDCLEGEEHGKLIRLVTKYAKIYNQALLGKLKQEND